MIMLSYRKQMSRILGCCYGVLFSKWPSQTRPWRDLRPIQKDKQFGYTEIHVRYLRIQLSRTMFYNQSYEILANISYKPDFC